MKIIKVDFRKRKVISEEKPEYCDPKYCDGACGISFDFHPRKFLVNGKYYCPGCFVWA